MKAFSSFVCASCRRTPNPQSLRSTTTTATPKLSSRSISTTAEKSAEDPMVRVLGGARSGGNPSPTFNIASFLNRDPGNGPPPADFGTNHLQGPAHEVPHRMHVYATKHNTHITFVQPPKKDSTDASKSVDTLLSLSAGNIGFRKAGRGSYDAGYQLAAFVLKQIQERGLMRDINRIEVILRGFGAGREAVSKALLGQEGRLLRNKITSVKDATRLKFGGARSPKPRRLG